MVDKPSIAIAIVAILIGAGSFAYTGSIVGGLSSQADLSAVQSDVSSVKTSVSSLAKKSDVSAQISALQDNLQKQIAAAASGSADAQAKLQAQLASTQADLKSAQAAADAAQADLDKAAAHEALVEAARLEKKMVWYGFSDTPDMVGIVFKRFQEIYPWAELDYYEGGSAIVATRMIEEHESGIPTADVVDITNIPGQQFIQYMERDMLAAYPIAQQAIDYPAGSYDPAGYWHPKTASPVVINYNTNLVAAADVPQSWDDLADAKWKGKLTLQDPAVLSAVGATFAQLKPVMGDKWEAWITAVGENTAALTPSATAAFNTVVNGEFQITVDLMNDIVKHKGKDPSFPMANAPVKEVGISFTGIGIYSQASSPNLARLFMEFFTSIEGQKAIVDTGRSGPLAILGVVEWKGASFMPPGSSLMDATTAGDGGDFYSDGDKWKALYKKYFPR